jgi:hypothetical protein
VLYSIYLREDVLTRVVHIFFLFSSCALSVPCASALYFSDVCSHALKLRAAAPRRTEPDRRCAAWDAEQFEARVEDNNTASKEKATK